MAQIDIETCFNYLDPDNAFFSSNEKRWINKIHKLKKEYPDEVEILKEPENNGGTIYARLPAKAFKLSLAKRTNTTTTMEQILRMTEARQRKQREKTI